MGDAQCSAQSCCQAVCSPLGLISLVAGAHRIETFHGGTSSLLSVIWLTARSASCVNARKMALTKRANFNFCCSAHNLSAACTWEPSAAKCFTFPICTDRITSHENRRVNAISSQNGFLPDVLVDFFKVQNETTKQALSTIVISQKETSLWDHKQTREKHQMYQRCQRLCILLLMKAELKSSQWNFEFFTTKQPNNVVICDAFCVYCMIQPPCPVCFCWTSPTEAFGTRFTLLLFDQRSRRENAMHSI